MVLEILKCVELATEHRGHVLSSNGKSSIGLKVSMHMEILKMATLIRTIECAILRAKDMFWSTSGTCESTIESSFHTVF